MCRVKAGWWMPALFFSSLIQVFLKLSSSIHVPDRTAVTILRSQLILTCRVCLLIFFQAPLTRSWCLRISSCVDSRLIAFCTPLFHVYNLHSSSYLLSFEALAMSRKTARFVLSCHSVGTSLVETALSAWMLACSFAGSSRCAFTLTRNMLLLRLFFFRSLLLLPIKCLFLALLLTSPFCLRLPIF